MRWSWKLGRIAGFEVRVHFTMLLLLAWIVLQHWMAGHTMAMMLTGTAFVAAVFGSVLLHEFGHALMARHYGIATRDITLLPIGGVAQLERLPEVPRQEIAIALAGPAVNIVVAALLLAANTLFSTLKPLAEVGAAGGAFAERLMFANLALAAFNMIPALPMDGGRVLRAWLAQRMDRTKATRISSRVAQAFAFVFAVAGAAYAPWLMLVALFVWLGATQEHAEVQAKSALTAVPVAHAMMTDFRTLNVLDTPETAVAAIVGGSQRDFPVLHGDRLVGVLLQHDLLAAMSSDRLPMHLGQVVRRECVTLHRQDSLDHVFSRLMTSDQGCFPVVEDGRLVGLLTIENLLEFLAFRKVVVEREKIAA